MPNHGGNLQHHHNYLYEAFFLKKEIENDIGKKKKNEKKRKERKNNHIPMVNKKISEMLILFLPCHFDYRITSVSCERGTPLAVLYDTHVLTMTRTCK